MSSGPWIPERFEGNVIAWSLYNAMARTVCSILWSPAAAGIDLSVGALTIDGSHLSDIGDWIWDGWIELDFVDANACLGDAKYEPDVDTIKIAVPRSHLVNRLWVKSVVVHEAVHASFDYRQLQPINAEDEAAAYAAQALYLRAKGDVIPELARTPGSGWYGDIEFMSTEQCRFSRGSPERKLMGWAFRMADAVLEGDRNIKYADGYAQYISQLCNTPPYSEFRMTDKFLQYNGIG